MSINNIHPTAIVDPGVVIHPSAKIGAYTVIVGNVTIGPNVFISNNVSIGSVGEHSTDKFELQQVQPLGRITIAEGAVIREFTTVNSPLSTGMTVIGRHCYVMAHSHVAHDVVLEPEVVLSTYTCLGGYSRIQWRANLGLGTITHQYTTIGAYAMTALNSSVVKDIPPGMIYIPGKELKLNIRGFEKWGFNFLSNQAELNQLWNAQRYPNRESY